MIIRQLIKRGEIHKNFCEDFLLNKKINERYLLLGVFDGCSGGIDSHFASSLTAKIISKESEFIKNKEDETIADLLKNLIHKTLKKTHEIRQNLALQTDELLSTIILLLMDKENNKTEIVAIGDGYISVDYKNTIIDQDNKPSYLVYFTEKLESKTDFDEWYDQSVVKINADNFTDLTIATDGLLSFPDNGMGHIKDLNIVDYLTKDKYLLNVTAMLGRKTNILKNKFNCTNYDDLAMFRVVKEN